MEYSFSMATSYMKAAVVQGPSRVSLARVAVPQPERDEVRVRIEGCGVCGSNLAPWEGRPWFKYPFAPGELGHEGWGRVDAVGPQANQYQPGDLVAFLSYHAYAEFDIARENAVVKIPESLAGQPFPGEALGCSMNVFRRCAIQSGQTVAVIGVGFLGALLVALSARAGAKVLAISRRPFALSLARTLGASVVLPLDPAEAAIEEVRALTHGAGCDCVIEAVGQQRTLDLATELTRERGRLVIAGYHQDGPRQVNLQLWNWRGLDVINAHERDPQVYRQGIEAAVDAVAKGELNPFPLYTHTFSLEQLGLAFEAMRQRPDSFLKALVIL